jgi:outer membrane protein assembly factor BamB
LLLLAALGTAAAIVSARHEINARLERVLFAGADRVDRGIAALRSQPATSRAEAPPPAPLWSLDAAWLAPRAVIDARGTIIATTRQDLLIVDRSGRVVQRTAIADGEDAFAGPLRRLSNGAIVVPVPAALALFAADGTRLATLPFSGAATRPRVLAESGSDVLVINLHESNAAGSRSILLALDLTSGSERWRFDAHGHRIDWALPLAAHRLLVSISGSRWEFDADGQRRPAQGNHRIVGLPLVVNDAGQFVWTPGETRTGGSPAVLPRYVGAGTTCQPVHVALTSSNGAYASCGGRVHAIAADGGTRWSRDFGWTSPRPLMLTPGDGVIALIDHGLVALTADGRERFRVELARRLHAPGSTPKTAPVQPSGPLLQAPDGTIYVGTQDNGVYALGPDGAIRWNFAAPETGVEMGYVTQLAFLDHALLVNASRMVALPAPSARIEPVSGEPFHDSND